MENPILTESIEHVRKILGADMKNLTIERAVFGLFFSGVKLSDGNGGLCFTPIKEIPEAVCCPSSAKAMPLSGRLSGRSAEYYLDGIFGSNVLKKALGPALCVDIRADSGCYCLPDLPGFWWQVVYGANTWRDCSRKLFLSLALHHQGCCRH